MRYSAHRLLIAPARPSAAPWRLLAGSVLVVLLFLALSAGYAWLCSHLLPASAWGPGGNALTRTPLGTLATLFVFGLLPLSLAVVLPILHKRGVASVFGPPGMAVRQAGRVTLYLLALYAVASLLPMPDAFQPVTHLPVGTWLAFLPLTLLGILVQTSAEEIVFRGYLQSQLAARFSHPAVWMVLPAAAFGLLHYQPGVMGGAAWLVVLWAFLFGLAAADLTARSGTLGPAIALHLINNLSAIALVAPQGDLDGLALFIYPFGMDDTALLLRWMPVDLAVLFCSWLAARLALRV